MPEEFDGSDHGATNVTTANWLRPELWSFRHVEQIVPTSTVDRGPGQARSVTYRSTMRT